MYTPWAGTRCERDEDVDVAHDYDWIGLDERLSLDTIVYGISEHEATIVHDERCW